MPDETTVDDTAADGAAAATTTTDGGEEEDDDVPPTPMINVDSKEQDAAAALTALMSGTPKKVLVETNSTGAFVCCAFLYILEGLCIGFGVMGGLGFMERYAQEVKGV